MNLCEYKKKQENHGCLSSSQLGTHFRQLTHSLRRQVPCQEDDKTRGISKRIIIGIESIIDYANSKTQINWNWLQTRDTSRLAISKKIKAICSHRYSTCRISYFISKKPNWIRVINIRLQPRQRQRHRHHVNVHHHNHPNWIMNPYLNIFKPLKICINVQQLWRSFKQLIWINLLVYPSTR